MMKSIILKIIIGSLFIGVFNLIFFVSGIALTDANWCSYIFVMVAYICLLSTPLLIKGTKSGVLAGSLWYRAISFFIIEVIVAGICLVISPSEITWPLISQGTILAIFIILQLMSVLANDATEASLRQQRDLSFSKQSLVEQLKISLRSTDDPLIKQLLNRCIDAVSYSPLHSCPEAYEADIKINEAVNEVCFTAEKGDSDLLKHKTNILLQAVQTKNLIVKRYR